jgi:hypothetical protein
MKKEKFIWPITAVVIVIIFSSVFYFLQINKQKTIKEDSEKSGQVVPDTKADSNEFSKKIECEKYKDQIIKSIKQFNSLQKPEVRDSNNSGEGEPMNNLYVENNELKEVFYSPKVNSCVYLESRKTLAKLEADANPKIGNWEIIYETYYLIDVLTSKEISFNDGSTSLQIIHRGEQFHSEQEADIIIDMYR